MPTFQSIMSRTRMLRAITRRMSGGRAGLGTNGLRLLPVAGVVLYFAACPASAKDVAFRNDFSEVSRSIEETLDTQTALKFEGVRVDDAAQYLSRQFDLTIRVDDNVKGVRIRGDVQGTLRECLSQLLKAAGLKWTVRDDEIVISNADDK